MQIAPQILLILLGVALIALILRDMFRVLFQPTGKGSLSSWIARFTWRAAKASGRQELLVLAGPVVLSLVVATWAALLALGWALIYWTQMPQAFSYGSNLMGEANDGIITALYVSVVTMVTLGYGDIVPLGMPLRIVAPLQAVIGFALFTAALSWVLSLHQAVLRKRSFAHRLNLLSAAHLEALLDEEPQSLSSLFRSVTEQLTVVRQDLLQFPLSYYFHSPRKNDELAVALERFSRLLPAPPRQHKRVLSLAIEEVGQALSDYARALDEVILRLQPQSQDEILRRYRADHSCGR